MGRRLAALAVVAAALAAPAQANAADHVWLSLNRVQLGDGWSLSGASAAGDFYPNGREIVGLTLSKRSSTGAVERHALRADLARPTVSFDGRLGRWAARRVGGDFDVDLKIVATGRPQPVSGDVLGCRGSFLRRAVSLEGTFVLRTGTAAFGTIRRARLGALVTYADGGVDCAPAAAGCAVGTSLFASAGRNSLWADPTRRTLVVSFRDAAGWTHILEREQVVVTGDLPTIRIGARGLGSVTFAARSTTATVVGACRVEATEGALTGALTVRFAGWGARTFRATTAQYRRTGPG